MLTNDDLEKFSRDGKLAGDCEVETMARELLAIREAGDEEVEKHFANLRLVFGNTDSMAQSLAADSIYALRKIVAERKELRQRLREAQAEIERLRVSSFAAPEGTTIQSLQSQIATLTAELAALKAAPGMEEIDALWKEFKVKRHKLAIRLHGAELEEICQLDEIVMSIRRKSICSIASRDEVVGLLKHILSCIITVKQENTPEWMEYIAEEVNRINEAMGDLDRVSLRLGGIVIVKGGPEIAEGKNA